ncbi:MAG: NupC/NupG family nucleoside CNT transporter [Myxococcales bacterium]|nr:NupC/NupG family nucleoside CNT transporter [Myxococcales bacterium]
MSELGPRVIGFVGIAVLIGIAWSFSEARRQFPWRVVLIGVGLQLGLGFVLLRSPAGRLFFVGVNDAVTSLLGYTDAGVTFVFGPLSELGFSFALNVLPIIVFMGSVFGVLYHLGIVQWVVRGLARGLSRTMGISGAESLAAVANIFVGMTEAPLLVRHWIENMTRSELFTLMVTGMATVAGSVLLAYSQMLGGEFAGHLVTASLLSAPAAILVAKVMVPELETPETLDPNTEQQERETVNMIDAASEGALAALRLAAYIGALLLAFVALIAMLNDLTAWLGSLVGLADLTIQKVLGVLFAPLAWIMGIPWDEARQVGSLLGVKTVLNEFLAYRDLATLASGNELSPRSVVIASYALCGFANFGSIAILIGGVGGIAPSRRSELARLGLRSILGGTLATLMTGSIAGMLLP